MRIFWIADAGVTTGFGKVTHEIGERLAARGHEVHVLASMYTGDWIDTALRLYPAAAVDDNDFKGRKRIVPLLLEIQPDAVFILDDPWVVAALLYNDQDPAGLLRKGPVQPLAYMPIDGEPVAAEWQKLPVRKVAMSEFGHQRLMDSEFVPHGVDTDRFRPVWEQPIEISDGRVLTTKAECKQAFGYDPDGFLALRVDRNGWRKDFGGTWKALVPVMAHHQDVHAHFHCAENDPAGGPILPALFSRRPDLAPRFHTPGGFSVSSGWDINTLVALYNAADVFVSTSMGEGFGLTLAEALACGTPVIAQDCSAISEVAAAGSILIPAGRPITAPGGHELRLAEPGEFTAAIEAVYQMTPEQRHELGLQGREHVTRSFNWDRSTDLFEELLIQQAHKGRGVPAHAV